MTLTNPAQTAHDLRVTARVLATTGHTTGQEITPEGRLCLLGAVAVATGAYGLATNVDRDHYSIYASHLPGGIAYPQNGIMSVPFVGLPERTRDEINALSEVLPRPLYNLSPYETVYHWNDRVCTGSTDAQALCIEAAEKLEANLP